MCFSATASFASSAVLTPPALYFLKEACKRDPSYAPVAVLPVCFGVQQFCEGLVWQSLAAGDAGASTVKAASLAFLFFAFFLWPALCPLAGLLPGADRLGRLRSALVVLGAATGALCYVPLLFGESTFTTDIVRHHIAYVTSRSEFQKHVYTGLYFVSTMAPFALSSDGRLRVFGVLLFGSAAAALAVAHYAFYSVWCFAAAFLSSYIWTVVARLKVPAAASAVRPLGRWAVNPAA